MGGDLCLFFLIWALQQELVIHFFQESLTVVRAERHSKISIRGSLHKGQGRPSTYLSGPQRIRAGARPAIP